MIAAQFIGHIAKCRGFSAAEVRNNFGGGKSPQSTDAKRVGMVDSIGDVNVAMRLVSGPPAMRQARLSRLSYSSSVTELAVANFVFGVSFSRRTFTQYVNELIGQTQSTTVPALVTYDFFFGNTPASAGSILTSFATRIHTPAGGLGLDHRRAWRGQCYACARLAVKFRAGTSSISCVQLDSRSVANYILCVRFTLIRGALL